MQERFAKHVFILLIFVFCLHSQLSVPSFAGLYETKDLVANYQAGNFSKVLYIAQQMVNEEPSDAVARYYLASAYTRLNQVTEAVKEYSICLHYAKDPKLKAYANQALQSLTNLPQPKLHDLSNNTSKSKANIEPKEENEITKIKDKVAKLKIDLEQNKQARLNILSANAKTQIDTINVARDRDIAAVPTTLYDSDGRSYRNPYYERTVSNITQEAKSRADAINENLSKEKALLDITYQKKAEALDSSIVRIDSESQFSDNDIQFVPKGSSLYVRNYLNYGEGPPPPPLPPRGLKAMPKKLF